MKNTKISKQQLILHLQQMLDQRIDTSTQAIQSAKQSRDNDTKSSAGDKYETGRAMMQIEIENNELQLNKTEFLKAELSKIDLTSVHQRAGFGSLVETNKGYFFISIGIGKIELDKVDCYVISLASPLGMCLKDKKSGDRVKFLENEYIIKTIS